MTLFSIQHDVLLLSLHALCLGPQSSIVFADF